MNLVLLFETEREAAPAEANGDRFVLRGASDVRVAHVRDVLRSCPGHQLRVGLIDGPRGVATISSSEPSALVLDVVFEATTAPRPGIDLVLALPRPKALKRLLPQVAAQGVDRIVLLNAARVEKPYFSTQWLRPEHSMPLLHEGLMQGGSTALPRILVEPLFRPFVEDRLDELLGDGRRLLMDPAAESSLASLEVAAGERVAIAIGPDRGFVAFERGMLIDRGFAPVSLGASTLRVDTACIAAIAGVLLLRSRGSPQSRVVR